MSLKTNNDKEKLSKWISKRKLTKLLFLLLIFIGFNEFFVNAFDELFVNTFFKYFKSSPLNDILFLVSIIYLFYFYYKKTATNFQTSQTLTVVFTISTICYSYYRFYSSEWIYIPTNICNDIKYFDLLYLITIGQLGLFIKNITTIPREKINTSDSFILDEPIEKIAHDDLDRVSLAKYVSKRIKDTNSKQSIAVAITAKWGHGKTSFLNLIKEQARDDKSIIIDFNPWLSTDKESLLNNFFNALNAKVQYESLTLPGLLKEYRKLITHDKENFLLKLYECVVDFFIDDEGNDLRDKISKIDSILEKIDKQVLIFIDDLDRLEDTEIISLIRLIRNSANFKNFKFIVAFDRDYVLKAIETKLNKHNYQDYLEKIFITEIVLPPISLEKIKKEFKKYLGKIFVDKEAEINEAFAPNPFAGKAACFEAFQSFRDVKRFMNNFISSYQEIKDEVYFKDLFVLESLRYKFPSVYELLLYERHEFIEENEKAGRKYVLSKTGGLNNSENGPYNIEEHIIRHHQELNIKISDINLIIIILSNLFYEPIRNSQVNIDHKSFVIPENYHKYILHQLIPTDLSEADFLAAIKLPLPELKQKIDIWVNDNKKNKAISNFLRINIYTIGNRVDFEKHISALIYLSKAQKNIPIPIFYELKNSLSNEDNKTIERCYSGDKEPFIKFVQNIFASSESPFLFESGFAQYILSNYDDDFILPKDELKKYTIAYLSKYLNSINQWDNYVWSLYHNCDITEWISKGGNPYQKRRIANPEANEILIDFFRHKDTDGFLYAIIDVEPIHQKTFAISNVIPKIFESFQDFGKFLDSIDVKKSKYISEFKQFYEVFKTASFKQYVEFTFKEIPQKKTRQSEEA